MFYNTMIKYENKNFTKILYKILQRKEVNEIFKNVKKSNHFQLGSKHAKKIKNFHSAYALL